MQFKNILLIGITSLSLLITSCTQKNAQQPESNPVTNQTNTTQELTNINVCYSGNSGNQIVTWYAFEKGLFKKYGLNVNLVSVKNGSTATASMIAGEMDFCQIAGTAVVNAIVAKTDLVMIAGLINTYLASIMVNNNIKTPEDLKGKALAISNPGGASDTEMRVALKSLNLEPEKDVTLLSIGGQGERLAAMETGKVVGTVVSPPTNFIAQKKGYRELLEMSSLNLPYQHTSLVTTNSYLAKNPAIADNFLKAIVEAIATMKKDETGTIEVLAKYLSLDLAQNQVILKDTYKLLIEEILPQIPYPNLDGIQALLTEVEGENPEAKNFTPADIINTNTLEKLDKDGFINQFY